MPFFDYINQIQSTRYFQAYLCLLYQLDPKYKVCLGILMYLLEEALIHFFQERVCTFDVTNWNQSTKYFQLIPFFDDVIGRQHMIEWLQYCVLYVFWVHPINFLGSIIQKSLGSVVESLPLTRSRILYRVLQQLSTPT